MAGPTGLEPATSGVTGQRSNQLSYGPLVILSNGLRPHPSRQRQLRSLITDNGIFTARRAINV